MSIVCDNHSERPAVTTHYVVPAALGARSAGFASTDGRHVDLCEECAAVLGTAEAQPPAEAAPIPEIEERANDAQRRLIFARCREVGLEEDERHALLERVTGSPSTRDLLSKDVDRVVTELAAEEARRRAA